MYVRPVFALAALAGALASVLASKFVTFDVELESNLTWAPECAGNHGQEVPKYALRLCAQTFKPSMCGKKLKIRKGADGVIVGPADKAGEIEVSPALYRKLQGRKTVLAALPRPSKLDEDGGKPPGPGGKPLGPGGKPHGAVVKPEGHGKNPEDGPGDEPDDGPGGKPPGHGGKLQGHGGLPHPHGEEEENHFSDHPTID